MIWEKKINCCLQEMQERNNQVPTTTVIARSAATWQSPGTIYTAALHFRGLYREIATGLKALAMTR